MTTKEFITKKIREISEQEIKIFPEDFLFECDVTDISLPPDVLIIVNEFFGSYEVLTIKGDIFCYTDTLIKAKYLVYAGKRKDRITKIPVNEKDIEIVVKKYEMFLDQLMKKIETDFKLLFPDKRGVNNIVKEIFKKLNLTRL